MSSAGDDSDDDTPQLSTHALQALQEFYAEQAASISNEQGESSGKDMPQEDWVKTKVCTHVHTGQFKDSFASF